jgi:hypothetical protein
VPYRPDTADVRVHVASANTQHATELCIRSIHRYAGHAFDLVVGDSNSKDGSRRMLSELQRREKLTLQLSDSWWQHYQWLDRWVAECDRRYAVFVDSDVEFRSTGWLAELVECAATSGSLLVVTAVQEERADYRDPRTGDRCRIAPRFDPCVLLVDPVRVRELGVSFEPRLFVRAPEVPEGAVSYDVGAQLFAAVRAGGLPYAVLPAGYQARFRHYGGLSWTGGLRGRVRRERLVKLAKIYLRLTEHRLRWPGMPPA